MSTGAQGVTLVELLVVLVILVILGSLSGAALWSLKAPPADSSLTLLEAARRKAIRSGTPQSVVLADSLPPVRFLPDGQAVGVHMLPLLGIPDGAVAP